MSRTPRTRRLALFAASAALAAGGALIPTTTAFAAPASAQTGVVATQAPQQAKGAVTNGGCGWDSDYYEYWEYTDYYDDYYYTDCYDYGYYTDCWVY